MSTESFTFPWQYSFPPFFTLQPHAETRAKQLDAWRSLVVDYCQRKAIDSVDVAEAVSSWVLFHNAAISRRLSEADVRVVLEDLKAHGHLEWTDKSKRRAHVYWKSPEEWAAAIYSWARSSGIAPNGICTVFEICNGDDTKGQKFHGLGQEIVVKALKILESQRKAELFDDNEGVKFF